MIRFFIAGAYGDHCKIVNAQSEQEAWHIITGDEWPVDGPSDEDWECTEVTLQPGQTFDLERFV